MRFALLAAMMIGFSAGSSFAEEAAFKPLLIEPAQTQSDRCRNGIVTHRIEQWRQKDHLALPQTGPFDSVDKIMNRTFDPVNALKDRGCDPRYLWGFIACTGLDDPDFKSENIVPRGVTANSDEEMAVIMKKCLDVIEGSGVSPAL